MHRRPASPASPTLYHPPLLASVTACLASVASSLAPVALQTQLGPCLKLNLPTTLLQQMNPLLALAAKASSFLALLPLRQRFRCGAHHQPMADCNRHGSSVMPSLLHTCVPGMHPVCPPLAASSTLFCSAAASAPFPAPDQALKHLACSEAVMPLTYSSIVRSASAPQSAYHDPHTLPLHSC